MYTNSRMLRSQCDHEGRDWGLHKHDSSVRIAVHHGNREQIEIVVSNT
jgi:hypothetical protein